MILIDEILIRFASSTEVSHSRPFFLILAFVGMALGLVCLSDPMGRTFWYGLGFIVVGFLSMVPAFRGIGRREPGSREANQGPMFSADDPEVAALPPTTTTRLRDQVKQARQRECWEEE